MNHFGCLKLVNCLQFCFLSALIVSRIAYTIGICLPFVCFDGCTTPPQKKKKTVVSGLVSKSLVFASFCFGFGLIQINPERYCNVTRSYSIKTALDFIGPLYILYIYCLVFLDKQKHVSKEWPTVFTEVFAY